MKGVVGYFTLAAPGEDMPAANADTDAVQPVDRVDRPCALRLYDGPIECSRPFVMPDLIVLLGPPAAGKAAVGYELAKLTGFRFFHNHMTAEPVAALFGWGTEVFGEVAAEVRLSLLSRAAAEASGPSIIFTFVWCFGDPSDDHFIARLVQLFESGASRVYFVELVASLQARIEREGTPLRVSLKPSKQDVRLARSLHTQLDGKFQMNSNGDFPYPERHLIIDTERHTPAASARLIAERFGLEHSGD